jgi:sporulation protein YlmC with PRC-barrel domain
MPAPNAADARKLIGRNVKNPNNDTIGEIKSVYITPDGKVDSVMVGVGGFLGVGEREVRLAWKDLQVMDNGEKVVVNMTKDQLKAMAPYTYKDTSWRGHVFSDRGLWTDDRRAAADARTTTDNAAAVNRDRAMADNRAAVTTTSTGDFNASGDISANAVIGAKIRNANRDTVGSVQDLYVDASGAIKTVVVSVGGFLGVGSKDVAVKWTDVKPSRDGNSLVLTTDLGKDQLKAMPDYKYERRKPASPDQAAAPTKPALPSPSSVRRTPRAAGSTTPRPSKSRPASPSPRRASPMRS